MNVKRLLPLAALAAAWCLVCAPAQAKMAMCAEKNALWGKFLEASGSKLLDAPPARDFTVESGGYGYETAMGRACWPSPDPIEEHGGVNLYAMVGNDPIGSVDILGNATCKVNKFKIKIMTKLIGGVESSRRQLRVQFDVNVDCPADCKIYQLKKGIAKLGGKVFEQGTFPSWTYDVEPIRLAYGGDLLYLWDSKRWRLPPRSLISDWGLLISNATFKDEVGVVKNDHYPSILSYDFKTVIEDRSTGVPVKTIDWSVYIHTDPAKKIDTIDWKL